MKAKLAALGLLLLSGPALAASHHRQPRQPEAPKPRTWEKTFPTDVTFTLSTVNGKPVPGGLEATLLIDAAYRGHGAGGCNNWSATLWPVAGQKLVAGGFSFTRKTCAAPAQALERSYLSILSSGATWDLVDDQLVVKSPRGTLTFRRGI